MSGLGFRVRVQALRFGVWGLGFVWFTSPLKGHPGLLWFLGFGV